MSDDGIWLDLLRAYIERRIGETAFHDRFLDSWRAARDRGEPISPPIDTLFYVVEAYCPDPTLRTSGSPFEAGETELRSSAELAFARIERDLLSGKLT